ncbi:MAG TPA: translocation/assembly module TamB domain-containing protein [Candidatus Aphodousia gallistercoris]|nr:translocation/assembly module TamB domain-containing protein [Candidatus Aphodousia gallistercoris]
MRTSHKIALAVAVPLAAAVVAAAWLTCTESGLKSLVRAARSFVPQLQVADVNGRLFDMKLSGLSYSMPGVKLKGDVQMAVDAGALLGLEIKVDRLVVSDLSVQVQSELLPAAEDTPKKPRQGLTLPVLPVTLSLPDVQLVNAVFQYDALKARLEKMSARAAWTQDGASVEGLSIQGEWNDSALTLTSAFRLTTQGELTIDPTDLALADNRVHAEGSLDLGRRVPRFDLKADIASFDFARFLPNMKGELTGAAHLQGSLFSPILQGHLNLTDFAMGEQSVQSAVWFAEVSARGRQIAGDSRLLIKNIQAGGQTIRSVDFTVKGTDAEHQALLKAEGPDWNTSATLKASIDREAMHWEGTLTDWVLNNPFGPVKLTEPMHITYDHNTESFNVAGGALTHEAAQLSVSEPFTVGIFDRKAFTVKLGLQRFDVAAVNRFLGPRTRLAGRVTGAASVTVPEGFAGVPRGALSLASSDFRAEYRSMAKDLSIAFEKIGLDVNFDSRELTAKASVRLPQNGSLAVSTAVADPLGERRLSGNLKVDHIALSVLNPLLEEGEQVHGYWDTDLHFAGTLIKPALTGSMILSGVRVNSTRLPFEMQDSRLELQFSGSYSVLQASLNTPQGALQMTGGAQWSDIENISAWINAKTDKLRISVPPMVQADLVSDVTCRFVPGKLVLDGSVGVPWAMIVVRELPPSAVDVSEDTVRLDRPQRKNRSTGTAGFALESDLYIDIGDNVHVSAFGLNADLQGRLNVTQYNDQLGLNGQITVPEGQFKAYGQDLVVQKGEFIFAGSASNPLLNIEAIRNPDSTADGVKAGVRVTGSANFPRIEIFSDPALSQTEALSYLMRGEGLDPDDDSDSSMLTSALLNLGLTQGNKIIGAIGESIGITGLGVETEGVGEDSSVAVSAYLLPGLKVKYGVSLFDSLATITLRYQIIPRLYIEAASGVDQALDLLYTFEF